MFSRKPVSAPAVNGSLTPQPVCFKSWNQIVTSCHSDVARIISAE